MKISRFSGVLFSTLLATIPLIAADPPSFRNDVLPVISKAGCNTGGCHGALAGKGGFRLSLFGYNPEADYLAITRESRGRRVEMSDPGSSLFLTKPTAALKHKGGKRIDVGSEDYKLLAAWISGGCSPPRDTDTVLTSLDVSPVESTLEPGQAQQLTVKAQYSDGSGRDVTRWAKFTSADETVATVDADGKVSVVGNGQGAITAWFSSRIVIARVVSPWPHQIADAIYTQSPRSNFIDNIVLDQLRKLNLKPSPAATDATFVRRAFLDTIGRLPTPEEAKAFVADTAPGKYERLADLLLARPEFIDYWTYKWSDLLLITGSKLRGDALNAYYKWVRDRVAANVPWDEFVRQIITARGSSVENGATNFFAVHQDPETMAENVSQAFLSLSINCAKCHNHPLEKWTNDQYYAFANLFSRVHAKGWGGDPRSGDGVRTLYVESRGDLIQPRTGKPRPPAPLDAPAIATDDPRDRREVLAQWLTDPANPYFTRAIANRVWANFMGTGIVESVDDMRVSNPASNEKLLAALADDVVKSHFNLRHLMRQLLISQTYRRSSEVLPDNKDDRRFYSRFFPRRLMAEVLSDAIGDVTGVRDSFTEIAMNDGSTEKTALYAADTRALQLRDSTVKSYFLKTFGRNARDITCECERSNQPSLVQALNLSNGSSVNDKLSAKQSRITQLLSTEPPPAQIINDAWMLCLSRPPADDERKKFEDLLNASKSDEKRQAVEDLYWSLLTSREFLFQHRAPLPPFMQEMNFQQQAAIFASALLFQAGAAAQTPTPVSYEKDIAPILRSYCAGCHNDKELEGKLSMETFAQFRKGGEDHGDPVNPGHPDESFMIRSIEGHEKPRMPPKDEPRVPAAEIETLKKWIASGAPGPEHDVSILRTLIAPKLPASATGQPVTAAAFSADGARLAVAGVGRIEVRDAASGTVTHTITDLPGKVNAVHFTADGTQIIIATGVPGLHGIAQLRDAVSGAVIREFGGHSDVLYDAEISPDGQVLATAGYDRTIRLWRFSDGTLLRTIDVHKGAIFDLAWHPSGTVLASASADETVKLWRVSDGLRLDTLNQAQGELSTVLFTRDGNYILAAGKDKRIHMWRFVSREAPALNPVVHSRFAHESPISSLALSADGKHVLSSSDDRSLKLWSLPDLVLEQAYPVQPDIASVLLARPKEGTFFIACMDGSTAAIAVQTSEVPAAASPRPDGNHETHGAQEPHATAMNPVTEVEPNNQPSAAMVVTIPAMITGSVSVPGDSDLFRFHADAGEALTLEVKAARSKSKLDSRLEILTVEGVPVEQVVLQATRDSWFTFRGKDSDTADDFRVHNWAEMELNEYLFADGEVVRLWLYPRGPDSGFKVYPGVGKRQTFFGTTALVHALGAPAYIVTPRPPGSKPAPNGLPVFRLNYENDDDPYRRFGADSLLLFTAPTAGDYLVRLTDMRGFGGEQDFNYTLNIRSQQPDFTAALAASGLKVSPGSAHEIAFNAQRIEGFDGPIRIDIANLPAGFTASTPVEIEAGQSSAIALVAAAADAVAPDDAAIKAVKITSIATIDGKEISHDLGTLGDIKLGAPAKVTLEIVPAEDRSFVKESPGTPLEFSVRPGQTITAKVRATRRDFAGRIELGGEDSGRNLPHGLYVDNIGLNGLLIVEGQTEREFFITASPIARPTTRFFHLRTTADDGQASRPALIRVLPAIPTVSSASSAN